MGRRGRDFGECGMPFENKIKLSSLSVRAIALAWSALVAMPTAVIAQDIAPQDEEFTSLGTIFINARRFEERLAEAPVAVTVQSGRDIGTGASDRLGDLATTAPNVTAVESLNPSFVIRGIGSQSLQGMNREAGVGIFLDEVYIGRDFALPRYLDDIEQTEIVRGSQSTIYGRNTIGGAINLISRQPGEELGGELEFSLGQDGYWRIRAAADVPLSADGRWLSRTFLSYTEQPDGITNLSNGRDDRTVDALSGRFSLSGELGDYTSLYFSIDHEDIDDVNDGRYAPLSLALNHQSDLDFPALTTTQTSGAMLRIEHDFESVWLRSVTAVRRSEYDLAIDGDFSSGPYNPGLGFFALQQGEIGEHEQFTQEFRIGSHLQELSQAGDFSWDAGLFLMSEEFTGFQYYDLASLDRSLVSGNGINAESRTYSAFANLRYQVTDRLGLHGGLRYTLEERDADVYVSSPGGTFFFGPIMNGSASTTSTNLSAEIGFDYEINENALFYARASQGFKSGGIAQYFDAGGNVNTYDPETSLTIEAGFRTQLLGDRLALDFTVFNTEWYDLQSNVFISDFQRVTANAASATSRGFEIGLDAQLSDEFRLRGSYGYLDAEFDDFRYTYFSATAGSNVTVDFSGNSIPYAPSHSASITLDWQRDLGRDLTAFASSTFSYQSAHSFDPVGAYEQSPTNLLDLSVGLRGDQWETRLWATNLLDEEYLNIYFLFQGTNYGVAAPGRAVGITFNRTW